MMQQVKEDEPVEFEIRRDDLSSAQTRDLLAIHMSGMQAASPAGSVCALNLTGLQAADITVWTAWRHGDVACVGALRMLSPRHAEIKSMRAHPRFRGVGAGAALLDHLLDTARGYGVLKVSLETGSGPDFEPALRLYRSRGFSEGEAFGDYEKSAFNQFLHRDLKSG